jgi:hypothetical protein
MINSDLYLSNLPIKALPWFRRLVADLSVRRPGFMSRSVHVGFVVNKMALGQILFKSLDLLSVSFHHDSILIYLGDEQQVHWWLQFRDSLTPLMTTMMTITKTTIVSQNLVYIHCSVLLDTNKFTGNTLILSAGTE